MFDDLEGRIDKLVESLLRGKRLKARHADAAEREAIMAAAELAAAREGYPRMSPAFRRKLTSTLREANAPGLVSRRTALGAVAGLAAGAVGAAALGRLPSSAEHAPAPAAPRIAGGVMQPAGGQWIEVAQLSQLSETAPTRVAAGDQVAFLFRQGDKVTGVSGLCTHWPCALVWQPASSELGCPCHPVSFKPDGSIDNPKYSVPPLPRFEVKVENGRVSVFSP
ncbi:MAG: Rieske (2Fe-2S) protein [Candidatus Dormibacteraeota bacterium]|nr:Rieske (2Fe-2S) protein [Candidatus Dormibacteraeota bacterium]